MLNETNRNFSPDLDELRFHLEQQIEENLAAGMTRDEARYAARRSIGGLAQIQEECRDMRGVAWIETSVHDLRYGWRTNLASIFAPDH